MKLAWTLGHENLTLPNGYQTCSLWFSLWFKHVDHLRGIADAPKPWSRGCDKFRGDASAAMRWSQSQPKQRIPRQNDVEKNSEWGLWKYIPAKPIKIHWQCHNSIIFHHIPSYSPINSLWWTVEGPFFIFRPGWCLLHPSFRSFRLRLFDVQNTLGWVFSHDFPGNKDANQEQLYN